MSFDSNVETIENVTSTDVQHSTINTENVQVSSEISHDSTNKVALDIGNDRLNQLLDRLSITHSQFDDYTQRRTQQISKETKNIIEKILEETKMKQRELLFEAQTKCEQFQDDYQNQLQIKINQLNQEKAQQLVELEKNLNFEQETILLNARQQIDHLQTQANQRKFNVLQEAQNATNIHLEQISEQVVSIGQQESADRLASTTTTVITSQATAQPQSIDIQTKDASINNSQQSLTSTS